MVPASETGCQPYTPRVQGQGGGEKRTLCSRMFFPHPPLFQKGPESHRGVAQRKRPRAQGACASSRSRCPLVGGGTPLSRVSSATGAIPVLCAEPLGGSPRPRPPLLCGSDQGGRPNQLAKQVCSPGNWELEFGEPELAPDPRPCNRDLEGLRPPPAEEAEAVALRGEQTSLQLRSEAGGPEKWAAVPERACVRQPGLCKRSGFLSPPDNLS